ncbi:hypothetical protein [Chromatium okenii]|uniref:hypothetical protein n=1 Tax=Chromatium okenii TaxID=61644 RepID=UPI001905C58F|nr:hypothetical protein [Chromatium okenii]
MTEHYTRWDSADYFDTEEDIRLYLDACIAEDPGDGTLICQALSAIARRRNLNTLVCELGTLKHILRININ